MSKPIIKNKAKYSVHIVERNRLRENGSEEQINWLKPKGKILVLYILAAVIVIMLVLVVLRGGAANTGADSDVVVVKRTEPAVTSTVDITTTTLGTEADPQETIAPLDLSH